MRLPIKYKPTFSGRLVLTLLICIIAVSLLVLSGCAQAATKPTPGTNIVSTQYDFGKVATSVQITGIYLYFKQVDTMNSLWVDLDVKNIDSQPKYYRIWLDTDGYKNGDFIQGGGAARPLDPGKTFKVSFMTGHPASFPAKLAVEVTEIKGPLQ